MAVFPCGCTFTTTLIDRHHHHLHHHLHPPSNLHAQAKADVNRKHRVMHGFVPLNEDAPKSRDEKQTHRVRMEWEGGR